jgi:hypothetical protein
MADARCTCGFTETHGDDETIVDHFLRVFTPEDDKGADGQVHLEGNPGLTCLCGFKATTTKELDCHFLDMFIPADQVDPHGVEHKML